MSDFDDIAELYQYLPIDVEEIPLNDALRQIADSLFLLREELLVAGRATPPYVPTQQYRVNGINNDLDSADVPVDITNVLTGSSGSLVWPTVAATARIVSDSLLDAVGGLGMQSVRLFGVDANFDYIQEDVDLNGTTAVFSTQQFLFVHLFCGINVGLNEVNAGTVTLDIDRVNNIAQIDPGIGQSQGSHFLVPNPLIPGKAPYLESFQVTAGRQSGFITGDFAVSRPNETIRKASAWSVTPGGPLLINRMEPLIPTVPGTRLWAEVTEASSNNFFIRAAYSIGYYDALPSDFNASAGQTVAGIRSLDGGIF